MIQDLLFLLRPSCAVSSYRIFEIKGFDLRSASKARGACNDMTEKGNLQDTKEEQRAKRRRLLSATATARIKRGMIRYLQASRRQS